MDKILCDVCSNSSKKARAYIIESKFLRVPRIKTLTDYLGLEYALENGKPVIRKKK